MIASKSSEETTNPYSLIFQDESKIGKVANVFWRCVPMEELRFHPRFHPLPEPQDVHVSCAKDLSLFRQDSSQWASLHQGRLTTSCLASVLGFYEPIASELLKIPKSLQGHHRVIDAWEILRSKRNNTFSSVPFESTTPSIVLTNEENNIFWKKTDSMDETIHNLKKQFPYQYSPNQSFHENMSSWSSCRDPMSTRLGWGSAQESTALLALLNHLLQTNNTLSLHESGMFTFESYHPNNLSNDHYRILYQDIFQKIYESKTLPPLGASPDAYLQYDHHMIEVVEVKCFSPFTKYSLDASMMQVTCYHPTSNEHMIIPTWHIPQLQFEILCAGPQCESCLLVMLYLDQVLVYRMPRNIEVS